MFYAGQITSCPKHQKYSLTAKAMWFVLPVVIILWQLTGSIWLVLPQTHTFPIVVVLITTYQCMPLHPDYNSFSNSGYWSVISGVEFETGNAGLFSGSPQGQNVPCARWLIPRSAIMMYPAKRNCPHGWNKEYEGNISLNQSTLANIAILFSRYIC